MYSYIQKLDISVVTTYTETGYMSLLIDTTYTETGYMSLLIDTTYTNIAYTVFHATFYTITSFTSSGKIVLQRVYLILCLFFFFFFFFCVPQLYLWGSPLLGEIFAYVTAF